MKIRETLRSRVDRSINMIFDHPLGGKVEARAILKDDSTLIIYLSSSLGCSLSCRHCWLTQTGQTNSTPVSIKDYITQASEILELLDRENMLSCVTMIHYNFMAQGDFLSNLSAIAQFDRLYVTLNHVANRYVPNVTIEYKLSTIFPKDSPLLEQSDFGKSWVRSDVLPIDRGIEFYYSLYSLRPEFRKRWLPKAIDPEIVGTIFNGIDHGLRLHHALIANVNDTDDDIAGIHMWLDRHDLTVSMNIVSYNPFNSACGQESSAERIETYIETMQSSSRVKLVQIIPKRAPDIAVACGMFLSV